MNLSLFRWKNFAAVLLSLFVCISFAGSAFASAPEQSQNPVLIFLHSEDLKQFPDNIPPNQRMYVLWPVFLNNFGSNRLLSVFSGVDWQATDYSRSFRASGAESWVPSDPDEMRSIGYFEARKKIVGGQIIRPIASTVGLGAVSPEALMMAADASNRPIQAVSHDGNWPKGVPLVYRASSWADAQGIMKEAVDAGGRAVLVILPSHEDGQLGRLWLSPKGWPNGFPVDPNTGTAGLISSRSLGRLLLRPDEFKWNTSPASADDLSLWFNHASAIGPGMLAMLSLILLFTLGSAGYCIIIEERGPVAACLIAACAAAPCAFILMDEIGRHYGVQKFLLWLPLAGAAIGAGGFLFYAVFRKLFDGVHPLFWLTVPMAAVLAFCNPSWSIFSQIFGYYTPAFSAESIGILAAVLTALVGFSRGASQWARWFARLVAVGFLVGGFVFHAWWIGGNPTMAAVLVLAWAAGEGWMRWPLMLILALIPNPLSNPILHGFAWAPSYCYRTLGDEHAVNLGAGLLSLFSPPVVLFCTVIGCTLLFGDRFLIRQMRMVYRRDPRVLAVGWTAMGLTAMAVFTPIYFISAAYCAFGLVCALFFDAVWAL